MDRPETSSSTKPHDLVRQLRFPIGFHFEPTVEELVDVYLRRKIEGGKLPVEIVNEVNILEWQPGKLVEKYKAFGEDQWYFFSRREPSSSNKKEESGRKVRVPGVSATWTASGRLTEVRREGKNKYGAVGPADGTVIGTKRVLIYHSSDAEDDGKWSMHEHVVNAYSQIGQYALYSIHEIQRKDEEESDTENKPKQKRKRKEKTVNAEPDKKTTKRKKVVPARQKKKQGAPPPLTLSEPDHQTPPPNLPSVPLQQQQQQQQEEYPPYGNQFLGGSVPMSTGHEQNMYNMQQTLGNHQYSMGNYGDPCSSDTTSQFNMPQIFGNQEASLMWSDQHLMPPPNSNFDDGAHLSLPPCDIMEPSYTGNQLLQQAGPSFTHNATQNIYNWGLGQNQINQQGGYAAIGQIETQDYDGQNQINHQGGYAAVGQIGAQDYDGQNQINQQGGDAAIGQFGAQDYDGQNQINQQWGDAAIGLIGAQDSDDQNQINQQSDDAIGAQGFDGSHDQPYETQQQGHGYGAVPGQETTDSGPYDQVTVSLDHPSSSSDDDDMDEYFAYDQFMKDTGRTSTLVEHAVGNNEQAAGDTMSIEGDDDTGKWVLFAGVECFLESVPGDFLELEVVREQSGNDTTDPILQN